MASVCKDKIAKVANHMPKHTGQRAMIMILCKIYMTYREQGKIYVTYREQGKIYMTYNVPDFCNLVVESGKWIAAGLVGVVD
jgi:hypothetical protein